MNTLLEHTEKRVNVNRARPMSDGPPPMETRPPAPAPRAGAAPEHHATIALSPREKTLTGWLSKDANSPDLVNFPYAFTVSMILMTGLAAFACGVIVTSVVLTVMGILITLAGCAGYGWSLYDD